MNLPTQGSPMYRIRHGVFSCDLFILWSIFSRSIHALAFMAWLISYIAKLNLLKYLLSRLPPRDVHIPGHLHLLRIHNAGSSALTELPVSTKARRTDRAELEAASRGLETHEKETRGTDANPQAKSVQSMNGWPGLRWRQRGPGRGEWRSGGFDENLKGGWDVA